MINQQQKFSQSLRNPQYSESRYLTTYSYLANYKTKQDKIEKVGIILIIMKTILIKFQIIHINQKIDKSKRNRKTIPAGSS